MSSTSRISPITQAERDAFHQFADKHPRLDTEMPATLPSGFEVTDFHVVCPSCDQNIPMHHSWVNQARHQFGQRVVEIWDARGVCTTCRVQASCYIRFRSDGTYDTIINGRWRQGSLAGKRRRPQPWLVSLWRWVKRLLK